MPRYTAGTSRSHCKKAYEAQGGDMHGLDGLATYFWRSEGGIV